MTPEQKLKHLILICNAEMGGEPEPENVTADNVDRLYQEALDNDEAGNLQDAREELRGGEIGTNLPPPHDRNYESNSVAAQYLDGSWIGWTYWYGGGKHGEPQAIPWIEDAYALTCVEEPRTIVHRTFTKVE